MTAQLLDGVATAAAIKAELKTRVKALTGQGVAVGLGTVLVGQDPASHLYVDGKHRDCAETGISSLRRTLPAATTEQELLATIAELNGDPGCTGYIVQLPLPAHIDQQRILEAIDPAKDADGLHPINLGRLVSNVDQPMVSPLPCTPRGCVELMERHGLDLDGKRVVVIGRGLTVGRPLGLLLTRRGVDATVVSAHSRTVELASELSRADVVIAAAGSRHLVRAAALAPGVVVLDVGVSRVPSDSGRSRVVGDVHPEVAEVASWMSPNPGGVGPMTRAMLLANVVDAAERSARSLVDEGLLVTGD